MATANVAILWAWRIFISIHIPQLPSCRMAFYYLSSIAFVISAPPLAMIAIIDTCSFDRLHAYSAYAFFSLSVLGLVFSTISTHVAAGEFTESGPILKFLQTTKTIKSVLLTIFCVSVALYLPIGLALVNINCGWKRLNQTEPSQKDSESITAPRHLSQWPTRKVTRTLPASGTTACAV